MSKVTPAIEAAIYAMADQKKSQREIAKALGLSQPVVCEKLKGRAERSSYVKEAAAPVPAPTGTLVAELLELASDFDSMSAPDQASTCRRAADALAVAIAAAQPEGEDEAPIDALAVLRRVIRSSEKDHDLWQSVGNSTQASRAGRTVGLLLPILARLEKESRHQDGVFHISKAEISDAQQSFLTKLQMLCDRGPIRCAKCNRELSVQYADLDPMPADSEAAHA